MEDCPVLTSYDDVFAFGKISEVTRRCDGFENSRWTEILLSPRLTHLSLHVVKQAVCFDGDRETLVIRRDIGVVDFTLKLARGFSFCLDGVDKRQGNHAVFFDTLFVRLKRHTFKPGEDDDDEIIFTEPHGFICATSHTGHLVRLWNGGELDVLGVAGLASGKSCNCRKHCHADGCLNCRFQKCFIHVPVERQWSQYFCLISPPGFSSVGFFLSATGSESSFLA